MTWLYLCVIVFTSMTDCKPLSVSQAGVKLTRGFIPPVTPALNRKKCLQCRSLENLLHILFISSFKIGSKMNGSNKQKRLCLL